MRRRIISTPRDTHENKSALKAALNRVPESLHRIYLMGICGTGMASLAGMLKEKGYDVTGSDQHVYPPMSHLLEVLAIPVHEGYMPEHLDPRPDLVVVGNVITKDNPEAIALSRFEIPYISFPQALGRFALSRKRSVVVTGTHGKTTTSALTAWIMEKAGMDPGFMIGGIPLNFGRNFKTGQGPYFIVEGDEYDTAFFDKGPKFLHYRPWSVIVTGIEFDHADIYKDLNHIVENFRKLIALIPADGMLIANADDPVVARELERARCPVFTYGFSHHASWRITAMKSEGPMTRFQIQRDKKEPMSAHTSNRTFLTPLYGRHNISNLLAAVVLAERLGAPFPAVSEAAKDFMGVKRRQQILGEKNGVLVLDDFAHHPTAVRETTGAVRDHYGGRRLIAVFEPRSNSSRRKVFQRPYADAFDRTDLVFIPEPPLMEKVPPSERFSSQRLVEDLRRKGIAAAYFPGTDLLLDALVRESTKGDVVLFMSNGAFDNLPRRLLERLEKS